MKNQKEKLTIRVTPNQLQVLSELAAATHTTMSLLIRSIIGDFITRNEDTLERIITGEQPIEIDDDYANN